MLFGIHRVVFNCLKMFETVAKAVFKVSHEDATGMLWGFVVTIFI